MKITANSFVTVDYLVKLGEGRFFPENGIPEKVSFCLGQGMMPPDLEEAMQGMAVGEHRTVSLTPEQAYGQVDEQLIVELPRDSFDPGMELKPGLVFETVDEECHPVYFVVIQVKPQVVVADFNHPLAGKALDISITVREVREATPEDLQTCACGCGAEAGAH